ncbi:MAG TPA: alpha/beta hydrolase-fold protein [Pyrinomonadaceae bacterium]|jgi:enterochelin esterase family protein|nr:alpha/beta hydrolase-fold protein [Pyrinomonadaceae bacterium]
MPNRSLLKITSGLFTLLILNAGLAAFFTRTNAQTQAGNSSANQTSAQQVDDRLLSPRLAALRDRIKSGDREALDKFWKEIGERGAPFVEEVPGNDRDVLVTMVWRAREATRNVFVFRLGEVNKPMVRLLETDLWYKTFQLQKGARFIYQFATNLPDPKEWRGITRFASALRNDPFNPLQFVERSNEFNPYEVTFYSAIELPSAEPQVWNVVQPKVPTGRVQRDKFASKTLGNERPIWIYTPHGYAADKKPYGLLVLSDGGLYVNTAHVATTLDNLIAAGVIPPLVAVMVDNPDRWRELSCNSAYADFLAQEVVPWARANYHATDRPEQTIIGGTSLGGLQAVCVGLKHAEVFGNVLSQSGDLKWKPDGEKEWEWLNRQFAASPRLPLRFSFEAGLMEGTWWWRDLMAQLPNAPPANLIDPTLLAANRNLRDTLLSKGYSVHYTEFNGNHGLLNWRGTLASHLIALVGIKPEPKISERDRNLIARSLIPKKAIAISQIKVAPALMRQYIGRYEIDPKFAHDFVIYVGVKDDSLWVKPSYLSQRPVIAESNNGFRDSEIPDLHLTFVKDEKGNVTGLTLNSGQGDVLVKRMPPAVPSLTGNTTFLLAGHADAEAVAIYGSFNDWIQTKNYCLKQADGWVCHVDLAPGKYTYKFLVDGIGLNDPTNAATADDGNDAIDSVIVVKPK